MKRFPSSAALVAISIFFGLVLGSFSSTQVYSQAATSVFACYSLSGSSVNLNFGGRNIAPGSILRVVGATNTCTGNEQAIDINNPGPPGPAGSTAVYGDGSAGQLNITTATNWTANPPSSANLQFTDITVATGTTFTVPSGTVLRATGSISISGTIMVSPGAQDSGGGEPNPGQSLAAPGLVSGGIGLNKLQASQLTRPGNFGGGAGSRTSVTTGGDGGGVLVVRAADNITINGSAIINANGISSVNPNTAGSGIPGGGGGAGGVVVVAAKGTLTVAGAILANGGNGSNGFDGNGGNSEGGGGGGGGGIIHLLASATPSVTGSVQANGGAAGANVGASGTINSGGGGGACGGGGGSAGSTGITPGAGAAGYIITTVTATPENLFL